MTTINSDGKPGYVYNETTDTWYQIAGKTDTSGTFEWAGPHTFLSTASFIDHLVSEKGINNFLNPSARDSSISAPVTGTICLLRQDSLGNSINQLQYYDGSSWIAFIPDMSGNDGKFLQTDGIITKWTEVPEPFPVAFMMMGVGY